MKKSATLVFLLCLLLSLKTFAQESILGDVNYVFLEKCIQAAKENYTKGKILNKQAEGIKTGITLASLSYLDIVSGSYFYRPNSDVVLTTPGAANANPYSVNGFQFGASITLGTFFEKPAMIKKAKIDYEVAKLTVQDFNNTLEAEVKSKYYDYIQQVAQFKLSTQNLQDITFIYDGLKTKFEKAETTLEIYDQARISLTSAKTTQLNSEVMLLKAKDALELLIGEKLSDIK